MAAFVFVGVTIIGFARHGLHFLSLFVPKGVPFVLLLLLVPIEIISYFIRPFSLSIRLFANMLAGHTMLKVFGGFVVMLGIIGGWAPLAFIVVFTGLELLIAFLQAYVFAILTCLYLNDAIHHQSLTSICIVKGTSNGRLCSQAHRCRSRHHRPRRRRRRHRQHLRQLRAGRAAQPGGRAPRVRQRAAGLRAHRSRALFALVIAFMILFVF